MQTTESTQTAATGEAAPQLNARAIALQAQQQAILNRYTQQQQDAALELFHAGQRMLDTGGGSTCGKLLLGLYNGNRFPFDLTDLRRLDEKLRNAAMVVIHMDAAHTWCEIHVLLDAILGAAQTGKSTGNTLELWAHRLGLKGRCKKEYLAEAKERAV